MSLITKPVEVSKNEKVDHIEGNKIPFIGDAYLSPDKRKMNHKLLESTMANFKKSLREKSEGK